MLQPRILVDSHRINQQTTKLKSKYSAAIERRCSKKTSSITTVAATPVTKMWSQSERLKQVTATSDRNSADPSAKCGFITNRRRQTTHKSAQVWSPALNISSSIYNLATFLILAITLYSSTLCMAQLSGEYTELMATNLHFSTVFVSVSQFIYQSNTMRVLIFVCIIFLFSRCSMIL